MPELVKAKMIELTQNFNNEKPDGHRVEVQFNPESLKLTFANQLVQPNGGDQGRGNAGRQFVGAGTTKLALQLWFDVTAMQSASVDDVRRLTQEVVYFMTPQELDATAGESEATSADRLAPPGVRFIWGSFVFDGMVEGLEENIEFFSPQGKPLRASITMTLSQQKILSVRFPDNTTPSAGQRPMLGAKGGQSLQAMAAMSGKQNWQPIAAANGIEDPLRLPAGRLVDLNATVGGGVSLPAADGRAAAAILGLDAVIATTPGVTVASRAGTASSLSR